MSASIAATGTVTPLTNKPTNEGGSISHVNAGGSANANVGWKERLGDGTQGASEIEQFVGIYAAANGIDGYAAKLAIWNYLGFSLKNPIDGSDRFVDS